MPVRVLVSPGTLPRSAAQSLRQIADWIERDRRLLSIRHWQGRTPDDATSTEETVEDQDIEQGENADQA